MMWAPRLSAQSAPATQWSSSMCRSQSVFSVFPNASVSPQAGPINSPGAHLPNFVFDVVVAVDEVTRCEDIQRPERVVRQVVEPRVEHADEHAIAVVAKLVQRDHVYLIDLVVRVAVVV